MYYNYTWYVVGHNKFYTELEDERQSTVRRDEIINQGKLI